MEQQTYNHYRSMDIYGNGVGYNVVIVKEDGNGDVYFIKEEDLDGIDVRRMQQILQNRHASTSPLWDVMSQVTLKNGMNALEYFHQLVLIRTASGQIIHPSGTRRGLRRPLTPPKPPAQPQKQTVNENADSNEGNSGSTAKKRGPGRPPKKDK